MSDVIDPIDVDGDLVSFDNTLIFITEFTECSVIMFSGESASYMLYRLDAAGEFRRIEIIVRTSTYKVRKHDFLIPLATILYKN